jgi:hypothetical protein
LLEAVLELLELTEKLLGELGPPAELLQELIALTPEIRSGGVTAGRALVPILRHDESPSIDVRYGGPAMAGTAARSFPPTDLDDEVVTCS